MKDPSPADRRGQNGPHAWGEVSAQQGGGRPPGAPAPAPARGRTRTARGRTRGALLDAMERLLAREGISACTSTAVAAEAGYAAGTFYRYFDDRNAALAELFADRLDRTIDAVADALTSDRLLDEGLRETLHAAVGVVVDSYRQHAPVLRSALAAVQSDAVIRAIYWERHARSIDLIVRFLRRGATAGLVRADADPAMAHALLLVLQGLNTPVVLSGGDAPLAAAIRTHVADALVALLDGADEPARQRPVSSASRNVE